MTWDEWTTPAKPAGPIRRRPWDEVLAEYAARTGAPLLPIVRCPPTRITAVQGPRRDATTSDRQPRRRPLEGDLESLRRLAGNWTVNALLNGGYSTVAEVDEATDDELLALRAFGIGALNRIRSAIDTWRLHGLLDEAG